MASKRTFTCTCDICGKEFYVGEENPAEHKEQAKLGDGYVHIPIVCRSVTSHSEWGGATLDKDKYDVANLDVCLDCLDKTTTVDARTEFYAPTVYEMRDDNRK